MDHPEIVDQQMYEYVKQWSEAFRKPIIVTGNYFELKHLLIRYFQNMVVKACPATMR